MDTTIEMENEYAAGLAEVREQNRRKDQESVLSVAQALAGKLNQLIAQGHDTTAFSIALLLAALKDGVDIGLDVILIGEIPLVGQLPGIFISATLAYFLWGKGWFNSTKIRIIIYGFGLIFDNLPFWINDAPMTILTVLWAWHIVRERAQHAERNIGELKEKTMDELEMIEQEI